MDEKDVFDLMQNIPDAKYACVILYKNDHTFMCKYYGNALFLEKLGLLDAIRHEVLQDPHE